MINMCIIPTLRDIIFLFSLFQKCDLLGITSLRNDPQPNLNEEIPYRLSILNKGGWPSGSNKDHWLSDQEFH